MESPEKIASNYVSGSTRAVEKYKTNVRNTEYNPMLRAIEQKTIMVANFLKSIEDGTWEKALRAVSFEEWKEKTATKGASNYTTGVTAGKEDYKRYIAAATPTLQEISRAAKGMPHGTVEDALAILRMTLEKMATLKGAGKS